MDADIEPAPHTLAETARSAHDPLEVTVDRGASEAEMAELRAIFQRVGIDARIRDDYLRLSAEPLPYAVMFMSPVTWIAGAFAIGALGKAGADSWDAFRDGGWRGLSRFLAEVARARGRDGTVTIRDPTGPDVQLDQHVPDDALRELAALDWPAMSDGYLGWSEDGWLYLKGGAAEALPAPRRPPIADR